MKNLIAIASLGWFSQVLSAIEQETVKPFTVDSYSRPNLKKHGRQMRDSFIEQHGTRHSHKSTKSKNGNNNNEKPDIDEINWYRDQGYECFSSLNNQHYKPNQEWDAYKPYKPHYQVGVPENEMHAVLYHCTCIGGWRGTYRCKPLEVPCFDKDNRKIYGENDIWDIKRKIELPKFPGEYIDDTYQCLCQGGKTGSYACSQKDLGCIDHHWTKKKYLINEIFEQVRDNGLKYNCECKLGMADDIREISCSSNRYCRYEGSHYEIGETFVQYNPITNEPEANCVCESGDSEDVNKVTCKNIFEKNDIEQQQRENLAEAARRAQDQQQKKQAEISRNLQEQKENFERTYGAKASSRRKRPHVVRVQDASANSSRRRKPQKYDQRKIDQIRNLLAEGEEKLQSNREFTDQIRARYGLKNNSNNSRRQQIQKPAAAPIIVPFKGAAVDPNDYNAGIPDSENDDLDQINQEDYDDEDDEDTEFADKDRNY